MGPTIQELSHVVERPVSTGSVRFHYRRDGIMHGVALPDRVQTVDDARENLELVIKLSGGVRVPLLLDIRNTGTLTREARAYYAGEDGAKTINALAFVANSAFTRVVSNLFIRLAKTRYPVRLFEGEEAALGWLGSLKS